MGLRTVRAWIAASAMGTGALLMPVASQAQDSLAELREQFERETDPVRKAKAMTKLGDAQWQAARQASAAEDFEAARKLVRQYLDDTEVAAKALETSGINAEKKPRGFKDLQIHVRKSLRELEQMILTTPAELRGSLEVYRRDLLAIEKQLINELFPRQPGKSAEKKASED